MYVADEFSSFSPLLKAMTEQPAEAVPTFFSELRKAVSRMDDPVACTRGAELFGVGAITDASPAPPLRDLIWRGVLSAYAAHGRPINQSLPSWRVEAAHSLLKEEQRERRKAVSRLNGLGGGQPGNTADNRAISAAAIELINELKLPLRDAFRRAAKHRHPNASIAELKKTAGRGRSWFNRHFELVRT